VSSGVTSFFFALGARNDNYELKKIVFIYFPFIWLNHLKFINSRKLFFYLKFLFYRQFCRLLDCAARGGRTTPPSPRFTSGCEDVDWIHLAKDKDYCERCREPSVP
jgi:hypothetical protein